MTSTQTAVAITGNTFPVKDQIKALGGRWDAERKAWMVPADRAEQARQLVAGAPKGYVRSGQSSSSKGRGKNWDPDAFAGYGRPRGAHRKACITDGNCSSFGSGRSCGGWDCDGY